MSVVRFATIVPAALVLHLLLFCCSDVHGKPGVFCPRPTLCKGCASFEFSANVSDVFDDGDNFHGLFAVGQIIEGYWNLNYSAPGTGGTHDFMWSFSGSDQGIHTVVHAAQDVIVQTVTTKSDNKFSAQVLNNALPLMDDAFILDSYANENVTQLPGVIIVYISISFYDATGTAFHNVSLPIGGINLEKFDFSQFTFFTRKPSSYINATIMHVEATPSTICDASVTTATTTARATTATTTARVATTATTDHATTGSSTTASRIHESFVSSSETIFSSLGSIILTLASLIANSM